MSHAQTQAEPQELSLEEYRAKAYNVLVPSQTLKEYSDMHEPVLEQVTLSPETDSGDVYLQEQGNQKKPAKYALTKQALVKLSTCAGILWHPTETRRTDDRSDKNYVSYQAVGGVRKSDGTWVFWKGEYDLDFEVIEAELEEQYRNKAAKYEQSGESWWTKKSEDQKEDYIQYCIRRDLLQKRKHKLKLAESGAMNRVIRALLGVKNNYTAKELQHPFVVCRVAFRPDYSDPEVRKQLTAASIEAMSSIYGPQAGAYRMQGARPRETDMDIPAGQTVIDLEPEDPEHETIPDEPETNGPGPEPVSSRELDFQNCAVDEQVKTLSILIERKGYDTRKLKKPILQWKPEHRVSFFRELSSMPDKDGDIPY